MIAAAHHRPEGQLVCATGAVPPIAKPQAGPDEGARITPMV
jgi:hypothetical protein